MAKKQKMKKSEARILIYLAQVNAPQRNIATVSRKLDIDYTYCLRILKLMKEKGWVREHKLETKTFYDVVSTITLKMAREVLE